VYPLAGANLKIARRLAKGHLRGGTLTFYTFANPDYIRVANIIAYNLGQIGLHVNVQTFAPRVEQAKLLQPGEHWDLGTSYWLADLPDPSDFVLPIVGLGAPAAISDPPFVTRERRASGLSGAAREAAFARLAQEVTLVSSRLGCFALDVMTELDLSSACLRG
jgi:ABC-type oligopeptide transport system substrate-binding subunit